MKHSNCFVWLFAFVFPQATDPDAGPNGQVVYRIINHPDLFLISENGSIYTKVPLDRELRSHYDLVVEASDGAVDPRRTTLTLFIQVTDINDNSPIFSQENYVVNVPENSPMGTVILKLSVSINVHVFARVFTSHLCFLLFKMLHRGCSPSPDTRLTWVTSGLRLYDSRNCLKF